MRGPQVPVVMVPRYTSFIEPGEFATSPLNVEAYAKANVVVWRGLMPEDEDPTSCEFFFEDSHDGVVWRPILPDGIDPGADDKQQVQLDLIRRWFRVRMVVAGEAGTGVSCWVVGLMELRVDPDGGA